jgi:hypothetical protein
MIEVTRHPYHQGRCDHDECGRHGRFGVRSTDGAMWPFTNFPSRWYRVCDVHVSWAMDRVADLEDVSDRGSAGDLRAIERAYVQVDLGRD